MFDHDVNIRNSAAAIRLEVGENNAKNTMRSQSFDQTYPCSACGYRIPPRELLRLDGINIRCPKCKAETRSQTQAADYVVSQMVWGYPFAVRGC